MWINTSQQVAVTHGNIGQPRQRRPTIAWGANPRDLGRAQSMVGREAPTLLRAMRCWQIAASRPMGGRPALVSWGWHLRLSQDAAKRLTVNQLRSSRCDGRERGAADALRRVRPSLASDCERSQNSKAHPRLVLNTTTTHEGGSIRLGGFAVKLEAAAAASLHVALVLFSWRRMFWKTCWSMGTGGPWLMPAFPSRLKQLGADRLNRFATLGRS